MKMKKLLFVFAGIVFLVFATHPSVACAEEYTLDDLFRIGLASSEKIKLSEENLTIARLGKNKALSVLIPTFSAYSGYTRYTENKTSDSGSSIQPDGSSSWGLRMDQSLSLSGREFTALDIAGETIEKSRSDLLQVREDYLLSLSGAFYDMLKAQKALEIAEANLARLTKYREAAQTRLRVGEATKTALLRAEGELSGARSDRIKAVNALESARSALARIVGIDRAFSLKEERHETYVPSLERLQEAAMTRRPELRGLETLKKIADKQVRYAKGSYWPNLSLAAVYARADQDPPPSNLNRESIYGTLNLNFPFYEGGLRKAEVRESEAKQRQAELSYADAVKSIRVEVENAYLDFATQQGIITFLRDQLAYAGDNYNAVAKQYEFGLANSIDVIDANNLLLSAQRQLADATYSAELSLLKLKRASGTLLEKVAEGDTGRANGEGAVSPFGK
ncbi:MAG: TolC family protein [Deltaproteobacteria bacterium]|nr:TolC family protein [Deltaproteobacteria bacterium]